MSTTTATLRAKSRREDLRLNVWALRSERDYERMRDVVDQLIMREKLESEERERMEVMLVLMENYEAKHHAIDTSHVTPLQSLRSLMEDHGMSASDLGRMLGNRALGSLILSGKRELSKAHIRKLADHFAVDASLFI